MGKIEYLIRVKQDTHGNIRPINYEHCPIYKSERIKAICEDENGSCLGAKKGNLLKEIREMEYLLQCSYDCKN